MTDARAPSERGGSDAAARSSRSLRIAAMAFVAALAVATVARIAPAQENTAAITPERGSTLFVSKGCFQCHGYVGQGALWLAPRLAPSRLSREDFRRYVRSPTGSMPPYGASLLTDAELDAILVYLGTIHAGRPASDIPALAGYVRQSAGATSPTHVAASAPAPGAGLYSRNCAACHGARLEGGVGPRLSGPTRSAEAVAATIRAPPAGMPSLYPSALSDADVAAIAAYVREQSARR